MPQGGQMRFHIENVGQTDYEEVQGQGDSTFTPGKEAQASVTKNSQQSFVARSGQVISFTLDLENPLHSSQSRILDVNDAESIVKVKYEQNVAGGLSYYGLARVHVSEISDPSEGVQQAQVTVAFEGEPTRSTSPTAYA